MQRFRFKDPCYKIRAEMRSISEFTWLLNSSRHKRILNQYLLNHRWGNGWPSRCCKLAWDGQKELNTQTYRSWPWRRWRGDRGRLLVVFADVEALGKNIVAHLQIISGKNKILCCWRLAVKLCASNHACQSLQQSEYIMGMHAETKLPRVVYSNVEIAHRYLSLVCRLATCS
jgi:hypothetical protein